MKFFIFLGIFLIACQQTTVKKTKATPPKMGASKAITPVVTPQSTNDIQKNEVAFHLRSFGESADGSTSYEIQLLIQYKKYILDTIFACEVINKTDFERYEIPATANCACVGWWAGQGTYLYATSRNEIVTVYSGWQDEEQEEPGYHWKKFKEFRMD
jgi:hypothetical protein